LSSERRSSSRRFGLFPKYAAALMGLVGGALVLSGLIEMGLSYRAAMGTTAELQRSEVRAAAIRIEQYLEGMRAQVADVSSLPWDAGLLDAKDRREEFHRLLKLVPAIAELRHVNARGEEDMKVSRVALDEVGAQRTASRDGGVPQALTRGAFYSPTYFKDGTEPYMTARCRP